MYPKTNRIFAEHQKLPPPPFITVPLPERARQCMLNPNSQMLTSTIKYGTCSELLATESQLLIQFIQRKGQQLRLEKAMMLSEGIVKLLKRWSKNEFYQELMKLKDAFPNKKATSGDKERRVPSCQWIQWVIYNLLREFVLLAKTKLECERTMKFWLGMISSSHHWGDSLVVSSIIARIWHLSSVMAEELHLKIYDSLETLTAIVEPIPDSAAWPGGGYGLGDRDRWMPQGNLVDWLHHEFDLPFEPADMNRTLSTVVEQDNGWILRVLNEGNDNESSDSDEPDALDLNITATYVKSEPEVEDSMEIDEEDYGVPVAPTKVKTEVILVSDDDEDGVEITDAHRIKTEPGSDEMPNESEDDEGEKVAISEIKSDSDIENADDDEDQTASNSNKVSAKKKKTVKEKLYELQIDNFSQLRKYWSDFFFKFGENLATTSGRKKLMGRIKKHEANPAAIFDVDYQKLMLQFEPRVKKFGRLVKKYEKSGDNDKYYDACRQSLQATQTYIFRILKKWKKENIVDSHEKKPKKKRNGKGRKNKNKKGKQEQQQGPKTSGQPRIKVKKETK